MQRHKAITPEEARELLSRVDALRKSEGISLQKAWDQIGRGHYTTYFSWKRRLKGMKRPYRKRKIEVVAAPEPHIVATFHLFSDGNIVNQQDLKRAA